MYACTPGRHDGAPPDAGHLIAHAVCAPNMMHSEQNGQRALTNATMQEVSGQSFARKRKTAQRDTGPSSAGRVIGCALHSKGDSNCVDTVVRSCLREDDRGAYHKRRRTRKLVGHMPAEIITAVLGVHLPPAWRAVASRVCVLWRCIVARCPPRQVAYEATLGHDSALWRCMSPLSYFAPTTLCISLVVEIIDAIARTSRSLSGSDRGCGDRDSGTGGGPFANVAFLRWASETGCTCEQMFVAAAAAGAPSMMLRMAPVVERRLTADGAELRAIDGLAKAFPARLRIPAPSWAPPAPAIAAHECRRRFSLSACVTKLSALTPWHLSEHELAAAISHNGSDDEDDDGDDDDEDSDDEDDDDEHDNNKKDNDGDDPNNDHQEMSKRENKSKDSCSNKTADAADTNSSAERWNCTASQSAGHGSSICETVPGVGWHTPIAPTTVSDGTPLHVSSRAKYHLFLAALRVSLAWRPGIGPTPLRFAATSGAEIATPTTEQRADADTLAVVAWLARWVGAHAFALCLAASRSGRLHVLAGVCPPAKNMAWWWMRHGRSCAAEAAARGHVHVLDWLARRRSFVSSVSMAKVAARFDQKRVVAWIARSSATAGVPFDASQVCKVAARSNHVDLVERVIIQQCEHISLIECAHARDDSDDASRGISPSSHKSGSADDIEGCVQEHEDHERDYKDDDAQCADSAQQLKDAEQVARATFCSAAYHAARNGHTKLAAFLCNGIRGSFTSEANLATAGHKDSDDRVHVSAKLFALWNACSWPTEVAAKATARISRSVAGDVRAAALHGALKRRDGDFASWLVLRHGCMPTSRDWVSVVESGDLALLAWLATAGCARDTPYDTYKAAARGHARVVLWLLTGDTHTDTAAAISAVRAHPASRVPILMAAVCGGGCVRLARWLHHECGCPMDSTAAAMAASVQRRKTVAWVAKCGAPVDALSMMAAAKTGNRALVAWLMRHMNAPLSADACSGAAECAHHGRAFRMIQWLRAHGCQWDERVVAFAIECHNWDLAIWAVDRGCACTDDHRAIVNLLRRPVVVSSFSMAGHTEIEPDASRTIRKGDDDSRYPA